MPQAGENLLRGFVHGLVHEEGFSFGSPRLSDAGSTVALPILRTTAEPRRYLLAGETAEAVHAEDPGRIDRIRVSNDSSRAVFLPPGSLFRGTGTASRGTTMGVLLPAQGSAEVEVKCVQPEQAIVAGAPLEFARAVAPEPLVHALLLRDQGLVWACVARALERYRRANGSAARSGGSASPEDLARLLADMGTIADPTRSPRPDVSLERAQCGIVVLDAFGVLAVEVYDNAESWRAAPSPLLSPAVHHPRLAGASILNATVQSDAAIGLAKGFLDGLAAAEFHRVSSDSWVAADSAAACATMDGRLVHLIAFRTRGAAEGEPGFAAAPAAGDLTVGTFPPAMDSMESGDVAVAAAVSSPIDSDESSEPATVAAPVRRRKVLTSGWDGTTFGSLEHYAHKEFRGDRSAAIRFLVRHGLQRRGYMGPRPARETPVPLWPSARKEEVLPDAELVRAGLEARIQDLERVAQTPHYAGWLRERARLELEKIASTVEEPSLSAAARAAADHVAAITAPPEPPEPAEVEAPAPPPFDVRPILRQAFAASAGGRYDDALALFDSVLEAEPDNRTALLGRAVAFRRAGKAQEALADLDLVLRMEPRNAAALLSRGRLLQERGDLPGALQAFDLLVAVAPNDWDVWMGRGDVLLRMGRHEDALLAYGEALRRNPDHADLRARIRALETARVPAPPRTAPRPAMPRGVEEGQSYLVQEKHREVSYSMFRALAGQGAPSLLITARPRLLARQELGVGGVRIVGLSYALGEDMHNPTALPGLTRTIERFIGDNEGRGVVLLDGLDELVANNGFRDTILFVERVNETILQSKAVFLVSLPQDVLPEKESALLERSLRVVP